MKGVSLSEFVANYKFDKIGENGEREYKFRSKPVLPNHEKFNPIDESTLVMEGETMEEAF
uniref:Uncharacterized protein n=1 Tax=Amphimedon queenslandica TaxID=400682 RepID=A0A1X7TEL3_AMPQE